MNSETTVVPELRLWFPRNLPQRWVVEVVSTGELFMFSVPCGAAGGWENRKPYRGYRESLEPVWGYCYIGLGVPLRRDWSIVCMDRSGLN